MDEQQTFRLTRLIMIDSYSRNRVSEIDLTGHITLNGDNGVGKTTLLRLLPMFFGETPSSVISRASSNTKFGRYYFPTMGSYVIYEYSRRGQKVMAVIHSDGHTDNVAYRFIDSPYRPELFKDENGVVQSTNLHRHLDKLGVFDSRMLTREVYKQVIQNTADKQHRSLAARFSFVGAGGRLTHIESVVTGILLRQITFLDMRKMLVSSVLDDEKISVRTRKDELQKWDREYGAYVGVMKKAPLMEAIEQADRERVGCEKELSRLSARANLLLTHLRSEHQKAEGAEATARLALKDCESDYASRLREAADNRREAESVLKGLDTEVNNLQQRKAGYINDGINAKMAVVSKLPALEKEIRDLDGSLARLEGESQSVSAEFSNMEMQAREAAAGELSEQEAARNQTVRNFAEAREKLVEQRDLALSRMRSAHAESERQAQEEVKTQEVEVGRLEYAWNNPVPSPELVAAYANAQEEVRKAGNAIVDAQDVLNDGQALLRRLVREFEEIEHQKNIDEIDLDRAQEELGKLLKAAGADERTLLGFLRLNKPNWAQDIGRVLGEDVLLRDDLSPYADTGSSLYGVHLDLEKLHYGRFANEEALQNEIARIRERIAAHDASVKDGEARMKAKQAEMAKAKADVALLEGRLSTARNDRDAAETRMNAARDLLDTNLCDIKRQAKRNLDVCQERLNNAKTALGNLRHANAQATRELESLHSSSISQSRKEEEAALKGIDRRVGEIREGLAQKLSEIASDRGRCLLAKGVSPDVLGKLRSKLEKKRGEKESAEGWVGVVMEYRAWLENQWSRHESLKRGLVEARDLATNAKLWQEALLANRATDIEAHNKMVASAEGDVNRLSGQVSACQSQVNELGRNWPADSETMQAGLQSGTTVPGLNNDKIRLVKQLEQARDQIRSGVDEIRRQMNGTLGSKPDQYQAALVAQYGAPRSGQEHVWIEPLRNWYQDEHLAARETILALGRSSGGSVHHFWNVLSDFKQNVVSRCKEINSYLSEIRSFGLVSNVQIEAVVDMGKENFWKAVEELHHQFERWRQQREDEMPSEAYVKAARDLSQVMDDETGLVADPVDLVSIRINAEIDGEARVANTESELVSISSNGLSYIILCMVMIAFIDRIRKKKDAINFPFVVDELRNLSFPNAVALIKLLEENNLTIISAFPDVEMDLAEYFSKNYKIGHGRVIGLVDTRTPIEKELEVEHV